MLFYIRGPSAGGISLPVSYTYLGLKAVDTEGGLDPQGLYFQANVYTTIGGTPIEGCYFDLEVTIYDGEDVIEVVNFNNVGPTASNGFVKACPLDYYPLRYQAGMYITNVDLPSGYIFTGSYPLIVFVNAIGIDEVPGYCA